MYHIAHIADVHIGAMKSQKEEEQLKIQFIDKLKAIPKLDLIIIAGDLFHTKILINSGHFKVFTNFFKDLANVAKEKNAKIRIIKGTESHDYRQLEYIKPIVDEFSVDCKIFHTVGKEIIDEKLNVLYIPEEYMEDKDEFYKEFMNDTYDLIVFHGVVTETCFQAKNQESAITMSKAPVLDTKKLMEICHGPILAGHIHTRTNIKEAIFYSGSFFRWCFGEEEKKGFYIHSYNEEDYSYTNEFIENEMADKYKTIAMSLGDTDKEVPLIVDEMVQTFLALEEENVKYRLIYNIPETYDKPELLTKTLTEFFGKRENVKLIIRNNAKILDKVKNDEKIKILRGKYAKVLDRNATLEEKIQAFIKIKYGKDIELNRIIDYLYKPISIEGDS